MEYFINVKNFVLLYCLNFKYIKENLYFEDGKMIVDWLNKFFNLFSEYLRCGWFYRYCFSDRYVLFLGKEYVARISV